VGSSGAGGAILIRWGYTNKFPAVGEA
jgi:hypothetical protein